MRAISRRTLLRGSVLGLPIGIGVPVLDAMLDGKGQALAATGEPLPKRFGTWYWGCGVGKSNLFFPSTPGRDFQLTERLQPLAGVRDYLTLIRGPAMEVRGAGHHSHLNQAFSATFLPTKPPPHEQYIGHPTGPSIDQIVASAWQGRTRFDSLQVGVVRPYGGGNISQISWKASSTGYTNVYLPDGVPQSVFMRLFSAAPASGTGAAFEAFRAARRSVLDATTKSIRTLSGRVSAGDRQRLDAHLEGLRSLEKRLSAPAPSARACPMPAKPPAFGTDSAKLDHEGISKAMADLVVQALKCDLTRVFSFLYSSSGEVSIYWETGASEKYHPLSHDTTFYYGEGGKAIVVFIMKQLAYLTEQLKATPEGSGNLLDRICLLAVTEMEDAARHNFDDHPSMLIGKAGGNLSGNLYVRTAPGKPASIADGATPYGNVLITAARAVDVPLTSIGNKETNPVGFATGVVPGILQNA